MNNKNHQGGEIEHYRLNPGIYFLLLAAGLLLLALLPYQAAWVDTHRGWFIQPMMGSALGLGVLVFFAAIRVGQILMSGGIRISLEGVVGGLLGYRTALISSVLFLLYIQSLSIIGFSLSTLIFITTLLLLSRLLDRFWFFAGLGATIALVLIFRVGLNVWMPDVWLYGLLPDQLADLANQYL